MTLHFHKIQLRKQYTLLVPVLRKMSQHQQQLSQMTDILIEKVLRQYCKDSLVPLFPNKNIFICNIVFAAYYHKKDKNTCYWVKTDLIHVRYHFNNLIRHWCFNSETRWMYFILSFDSSVLRNLYTFRYLSNFHWRTNLVNNGIFLITFVSCCHCSNTNVIFFTLLCLCMILLNNLTWISFHKYEILGFDARSTFLAPGTFPVFPKEYALDM